MKIGRIPVPTTKKSQDGLEYQIQALLLKMDSYMEAAEKRAQDHETRLRGMEELLPKEVSTVTNLLAKLDGKLDKEIARLDGQMGTLRERVNIFATIQVAFSTVLSTIAGIFGANK